MLCGKFNIKTNSFQIYKSIEDKYLLLDKENLILCIKGRNGERKTMQNQTIQNIQDLVFDEKIKDKFLAAYEANDVEKQIEILELYRKNLLEKVHESEKNISNIDYLIYQIGKCHKRGEE